MTKSSDGSFQTRTRSTYRSGRLSSLLSISLAAQEGRGVHCRMARRIIWVATATFRGYGCSGCGSVFTASGALVGDTLEEMKRRYEKQRDNEFADHVCTEYPRKIGPKPK